MVDADQTFVIVGGGLAGAKAAETLRSEGFTGRVILIGDERDHPYERPPLSKGYLPGQGGTGQRLRPRTGLVRRARHRAAPRPAGRRDRPRPPRPSGSGDGTVVHYDKLLLATGAEPRRLDIPGTELAGVHHLRRLAHAERLKGVLASLGRDNGHIVIAGAGWIGLEVAAAARELRRRGHRRRARADPAARGPRPGARPDLRRPARRARRPLPLRGPPHRDHRPGRHGAGRPHRRRRRSTRPTTCSPRSAPPRAPRSPSPPGSNSPTGRRAAASPWTPRCAPPTRTSTRPATSRPSQHPLLRDPAARRALGQRAQRRPGRRPRHARPGGDVRPRPVLLLRPVRPRAWSTRAGRPRARTTRW